MFILRAIVFLILALLAAYTLIAVTMMAVAAIDTILNLLGSEDKEKNVHPEKYIVIASYSFAGGLLASLVLFAASVNSNTKFSDSGYELVAIFIAFELFLALLFLVAAAQRPVRTAIAALFIFAVARMALEYFGYWLGSPPIFLSWQQWYLPDFGYVLDSAVYLFAIFLIPMILSGRRKKSA